MKSSKAYIEQVIANVKDKHPEKKEFIQAVEEYLNAIKKYVDKSTEINKNNLLSLIIMPERIIKFRVPWQTDTGEWRTNEGIRVQYNSALSPYKVGIRFIPSVNESIIRFLGFE